MGADTTNSQEHVVPVSHSQYDRFVRELEQRLYDGCSVTFTVPRHTCISLAHDVLKRLEVRACLAVEIDLSNVSTVEEFALRVLRAVLQVRIGTTLSNYSLNDFLECISRPDIHAKIQDLVEVSYLHQLKDDPLALLDEAVSLLQRIAEQSDTRVVVWFHEFQVIEKIDDFLPKRLRALFQLQSHVTYAFVGSDTDVMTMLFTNGNQALYRFAVMMTFPSA